MRRFNREVYKETHDLGATVRYTSAEFNDLLGSQDRLVVQYSAIKIGGTDPTLTIEAEGSNNGVDWVNLETLINAAELTAATVNTGIQATSGSVVYPAFVRLTISMGGTTPSAEIQVTVCGRDVL